MQSFKFLKLFFRLPAKVIQFNFCCVIYPDSSRTPLYASFITQLQLCGYSYFAKCFTACLLVILTTQNSIAQTAHSARIDSNYVDTISMNNYDSVVAANNNESSGYDDQEDGYIDTTVKHIYDTSEFFFNTKHDYDSVFTEEKITQRHLIDEEVKALKNEDDFWYIPAIEKLETRLKNDPLFRDSLLNAKNHELTDNHKNDLLYQPWFNTLLWIIIIGIFMAALVYFLFQNKIAVFAKASASSGDDAGEDEAENIFNLSYTKLIQNAEKEKNYRIAVRLMFLQTLKMLSDTNFIRYQPDYTDLHYLQQLEQSKYYDQFFKVTRHYEYVWYGKFNITAQHYNAIKNDFIKLYQKIS